jgi:large subunit ribosomal protein L1
MKFRSKRYKALKPVSDHLVVEDAIPTVKGSAKAKFDESVDVAINLFLEKKHSIRDTVTFPNSFGKVARVLVFAKGKKAEDARAAGADFVGDDDLIEKIATGWTEFDVAVATPDMMRSIAKVAKVLGTKGLMPNPKAKTVTENILETVKEVRSGRREFRADGAGTIHFAIGKASMDDKKLLENFREFYAAVLKKKPADLKGDYVRSIHITSTMGLGIEINRKNPFKVAA